MVEGENKTNILHENAANFYAWIEDAKRARRIEEREQIEEVEKRKVNLEERSRSDKAA